MSFALLLAKNVHLSIGEKFCAFPCQKICTSVSPFLNGAEFTLSVAKHVALFETVRILRTVKWRDWHGIEAAKQTMEFPAAPFFLVEISKKWIKLIPKTIGNRKRDCAWGCAWGIKQHLRKSADRKAQIRKAFVPLTELICAFRSADFLRCCFIPQAQPHAQSLSLFPIVFGINIIPVVSPF